MTCEAYQALLDQLLDGEISPEEEKELLAHEAECPECAELHASLAALKEDLSALAEDVPPLPEDFHASWTKKLENTPQEKPESRPEELKNFRRIFFSPAGKRILAACAVFAVVLGGSLLSLDLLQKRTNQPVEQAPVLYESKSDQFSESFPAVLGTSSNASFESAMMEEAEYEMDEAPEEAAPYEYSDPKIIQAATLTLATGAFDDTISQLESLCDASLGWSSRISSSTDSDGLRHAVLELQVPSEAFHTFLSSAKELGRVAQFEESADDATASYEKTTEGEAFPSEQKELKQPMAEVPSQADRLESSPMTTGTAADFSSISVTIDEESP